MDINKYIGKFLLKNKYCSLPGLGVFDLKKDGAKVNPSNETISAPVYKITFTPVGSIDDTFASFIATAENVSISNASNNIKEYCKNVKEELAKTGKYDIPLLGSFSIANNKIAFQQSDDLDMGAEPAPLTPLIEKLKTTDSQANKPDYSYPPAKQHRQLPIMKIALVLITCILLGTGAYFGYDYYQKNKEVAPLETIKPAPIAIPVDTLATTIIQDSIHHVDSTHAVTDTSAKPAVTAASAAQPNTLFKVAILSFDNEMSATAKANKLKNYGNNAAVASSNGRFVVVINASNPTNDTTKLVDSLRRFFNPKGNVFIMK